MPDGASLEEKMRAMNEALVLGLVRQDELSEITRSLNVQLQREIVERQEAEERLRFLMNELAHRGKNLLAVVQALASRSLSGTRPLEEERRVLSQRIQALARSQSSLVTGGFEGAAVAEIVRLECESFADRVTAAGPDVMLIRRVAQTFTFVLHELATNALKHGALAEPGGRIAIAWSVEGTGADARFRFQWRELGGPPVVAPTRMGFGRLLLESAAAQDFGSLPVIRFEPSGLVYEIDALLQPIVPEPLS